MHFYCESVGYFIEELSSWEWYIWSKINQRSEAHAFHAQGPDFISSIVKWGPHGPLHCRAWEALHPWALALNHPAFLSEHHWEWSLCSLSKTWETPPKKPNELLVFTVYLSSQTQKLYSSGIFLGNVNISGMHQDFLCTAKCTVC